MSRRFDLNTPILLDMVVFDREERVLLIGETKAMNDAMEMWSSELLGWIQQLDPDGESIPYALFADFDRIWIFQPPYQGLLDPVCSFKTADILISYQPHYGRERIFDDYFRTLIGAWLHDFASAGDGHKPPGFDELARIGLATRLERASFMENAEFGFHWSSTSRQIS